MRNWIDSGWVCGELIHRRTGAFFSQHGLQSGLQKSQTSAVTSLPKALHHHDHKNKEAIRNKCLTSSSNKSLIRIVITSKGIYSSHRVASKNGVTQLAVLGVRSVPNGPPFGSTRGALKNSKNSVSRWNERTQKDCHPRRRWDCHRTAYRQTPQAPPPLA